MKDKFTLEQIVQFLFTIIPIIIAGTIYYNNIENRFLKLECKQFQNEIKNAQLEMLRLKRELRDKVDSPYLVSDIQIDILDEENTIKRIESIYYNKCSDL